MRSKKAALNMACSLLNYAIIVVLNLATRAVFNRTLGVALVGVETLMRSIMSMLSLAELGIGSGLMYKLYKPILNKDFGAVATILRFYKRAYRYISAVMLIGGLILCFFIKLFVKEQYSPIFLGLILFLYLLDTIASYIYAYKKALLTADQRSFIINLYHTAMQLFQASVQIALLYFAANSKTPNHFYLGFAAFAAAKIVFRVFEALLVSRRFNRMYPELINCSRAGELEKGEKQSLINNIKAMMMHKIRWFSVNMTSSMIISGFVSSVANGIYGNYTMITSTLFAMTDELFGAICASFGNLMAAESEDYVRNRFDMLLFVNFLIYSFFTASVYTLIEPFIKWWIGVDPATGKYTLFGKDTLILLMVYFYIVGMRKVLNMVRDSAGLYRPDRYFMLTEAILNLVLALVLVRQYGVNGVLIANIISVVSISMWTTPYVVYKYILKDKLVKYYIRIGLYAIISLGEIILTKYLCGFVQIKGLSGIAIYAIICIIIPNAINFALFCKSKEMKCLKGIVISIIKR